MRPDTGLGATSWVYIMASRRNGTVYVGVTSDLIDRVRKHRDRVYPDSFTSKYGCHALVWYQALENVTDAIKREKAVKKYRRARKLALIEERNPQWLDLYDDLFV